MLPRPPLPFLAAALLGGGALLPRPAAAQAPDVALVVLVTVDQLRPDYLVRYAAQLDGGLGRLARAGLRFTDARQDHAITETAPGHATLLSGRFPAGTGIVNNDRGVPDPAYPLLEVPGVMGASPARFRGTTLFDWLRAAGRRSEALSISRKDRGAILPLGRAGTHVYWFARGRATTSRWYADSLPAWVRAWQGRRPVAPFVGAAWTPRDAAETYLQPDTFAFEDGGREPFFPHAFATDEASSAAQLEGRPWIDSLTLDLALEGSRALGLGRRGTTDLLSVSLSATDAVGHKFGPQSRELEDQLRRMDRWLGWFLDSLAVLVPGRTVVALTADHGVQEMPAYARALGRDAGGASPGPVAADLASALRARYGTDFGVEFDSGVLFADVAALRARGINVDSLADASAAALRQREGIANVWTRRALPGAGSEAAARFRRSLPADAGWLAVAETRPGWIWSLSPGYATHGTPHDADVQVPLLLWTPGLAPATVARTVRTVDLGPTLAALLGVRPTERVDGRPLPEVLRAWRALTPADARTP